MSLTEKFVTFSVPSTMVPADALRALKVRPKPDFVSVPDTERLVALRSDARPKVPETASAANCWPARSLTVFAAPVRVTDDVAWVNVEPVPEVSQLPPTVQDPVVRVSVPLVPPVIVRLATLTVDAFEVSVAPLPTTRDPPVSGSPAVARVALALSVSVPPQRNPFADIVNVAAAVGLNWTWVNSFAPRLPKVYVTEPPGPKMTVPLPALQDALVEAFVQVPATVQVSDPKAMKEVEAEMVTLPAMATFPEVDVIDPPLRTRLPFTVSRFVPFVRPPAGIVKEVAVSWEDWFMVPVIVTAAKALPVEMPMDFEAPLNVTADEPEMKFAEDTDKVFHEPATLRAALPNAVDAEAPEDVTSELKVAVLEARVSAPLNVRTDAIVVVTPGLTVRL